MTAQLTNYAGFGVHSETGLVTLVDPCTIPTHLSAGVPTQKDSDYTVAAIWDFPAVIVSPSDCNKVFSCQYTGGPYTGGLNLCSLSNHMNGQLSTTITFSTTTGQLIFDTDDYQTFPSGVYTYLITITMGDRSDTVTAKITLHPGCGNADLTIMQEPTMEYYYFMIGEQTTSMNIFTFDINTVVVSSSDTNCGTGVIEFIHLDGSALGSIFIIS